MVNFVGNNDTFGLRLFVYEVSGWLAALGISCADTSFESKRENSVYSTKPSCSVKRNIIPPSGSSHGVSKGRHRQVFEATLRETYASITQRLGHKRSLCAEAVSHVRSLSQDRHYARRC